MGFPQHVAIIMDGNGRWAADRGRSRSKGHKAGVDAADRSVEAAAELGIKHLSLYAFSTENWKRPAFEVNTLMAMLRMYLKMFLPKLLKHNIRFHHLGLLEGIPLSIQTEIQSLEEKTIHCDRMTFHLAVNYGSRLEIVEAAKTLIKNHTPSDQIDESLFQNTLWTGSAPDVDLLIRTGGDNRISNFLLWQSAYAEIITLDTYWPDFGAAHLKNCLEEFAQRERRFGGLA